MTKVHTFVIQDLRYWNNTRENPMNADNRIMFRLSTPKKEAFLNKVNEEGKKASEVLIWLIDRYLRSGEDLEESQSAPELKTIKDRVNQHDLEIQFLKQELLGE